MCVNAETEEYHTEMDCTYTLIHVPNQKRDTGWCKYHFLFDLSTAVNISFHMVPGMSIMFSGQFATHRQSCDTINRKESDVFINFASYGNARLYRHIRNSFKRVKTDNTSRLK